MNKDKMVEEMAAIIKRERQSCITCDCHDCEYFGRYNCSSTKKATALYNANYCKLVEGEIVVKESEIGMLKKTIDFLEMEKDQLNKQLEQAKQEKREILQMIYDKGKDTAMICLPTIAIKQLAKAYGIELED